MKYPKFYDEVESIKLYDPLSEVLGSFDNGEIEITYKEIVKSAGHSCPTVAGAYLMSLLALKALYSNQLPVRGEIKVSFKEKLTDGVTGVIANVISNITGATKNSGFKGLGGKFVRHSLMQFETDIKSNAKFTRVDNNHSVDVYYNPSLVQANPKTAVLMQKILQNSASDDEKNSFKILWQNRVKEILLNYKKYDNLIKII